MSGAYYNEIDPYASEWLRNLIAAGHIAPGDVDERSISDVSPVDLLGYTQCHFFAGIGVWSHALRAAGWPDDRPVWTGSCPCQPFSAAGKGEGTDDARHLWPEWFRLIREHRPVAVFGEQVSAAIRHGWLDLVSADLEGAGYAVGSAVLGAHSVGAPHIRQRLYFVAESEIVGRQSRSPHDGIHGKGVESSERESFEPAAGSKNAGKLAYAEGGDRGLLLQLGRSQQDCSESERGGAACELADAQRGTAERHGLALDGAPGGAKGAAHERERLRDDAGHGLDAGVAQGDTHDAGSQGRGLSGADRERVGAGELAARQAGASFWSACDWLLCIDGKARPVEPGTFPLAHGVAGRVGRLRAYGNAINAEAAAAFVRAYQEGA